MQPIHDRMTTLLKPRDYAEYLKTSERPSLHLLRILSVEEMRAALVEKSDITDPQMSLFDSQ
jgi:putative SOS response-associated peptidase YedK